MTAIFDMIDGVEVELTGDRLAEYLAQQISPLMDAKARKIDQIRTAVAVRLTAGAPVEHEGQTLHVDVGDGSRADIGSMATNALATIATGGQAPWLEAYILGWITIENICKPLPTPQDGLAFASSVAVFYADTRQHGRTLKDAVLAAADVPAVDAIDIESGWPS